MTDYNTRSLTVEETAKLIRKLTIAIGHKQATQALMVIAEMGAGIFMAQERGE